MIQSVDGAGARRATVLVAAFALAVGAHDSVRLALRAAAPVQQPAALRIVVLEGEDAVNVVDKKTAVVPVVEVRDRNDLPVVGATVRFVISGRNTTTFANGVRQLVVVTDSTGRATAAGLSPVGQGAVQIQTTAVFQQQAATITIHQTNIATAGAATASGSGATAGGAAGGTGGAGGGLSGAAIGGIAAGAGGAAAAAVAVGKKDGDSTSSELALLLPPSDAMIPQNDSSTGCVPSSTYPGVYGWKIAFDWSDVSGATQYHLFVKSSFAQNPVVDLVIPQSNYTAIRCGYVSAGGGLVGWFWQVRAFSNGTWGPFTAPRPFSFLLCRLPDGTPCV